MTTTHAEIVRYRVERAYESLREARLLAEGGLWTACVNRLYYACFYAVSALLFKRGLSSSKHTGVRSLFNHHFVKTDQVPRELGAIYNDLFENRQKSDYMDLVRFDGEQVRPWIEDAQLFVDKVIALPGGELPAGDSANREQSETDTDRPEDQ